MRLIDADAFDKVLKDAQTECKIKGGNFRFGVLNNVRANLAKATTVGGWIRVADRLPDQHECDAEDPMDPGAKYMLSDPVLITDGKDFELCELCDGSWGIYSATKNIERRVTHWMPLPKPPEEDEQ